MYPFSEIKKIYIPIEISKCMSVGVDYLQYHSPLQRTSDKSWRATLLKLSMVGCVYILTMKTSIPKKQLTSPFFFKHNAKIPKKKQFTDYGQKHTTHQFILRLIQYNFDN